MNPIFIAVSVAYLASSVVGNSDYYCPEPEIPTYGYIYKGQRSYYKVGSVVEYACQYGYTLYGGKRIRCASKGRVEWNGDPPVCKKGNRI